MNGINNRKNLESLLLQEMDFAEEQNGDNVTKILVDLFKTFAGAVIGLKNGLKNWKIINSKVRWENPEIVSTGYSGRTLNSRLSGTRNIMDKTLKLEGCIEWHACFSEFLRRFLGWVMDVIWGSRVSVMAVQPKRGKIECHLSLLKDGMSEVRRKMNVNTRQAGILL